MEKLEVEQEGDKPPAWKKRHDGPLRIFAGLENELRAGKPQNIHSKKNPNLEELIKLDIACKNKERHSLVIYLRGGVPFNFFFVGFENMPGYSNWYIVDLEDELKGARYKISKYNPERGKGVLQRVI